MTGAIRYLLIIAAAVIGLHYLWLVSRPAAPPAAAAAVHKYLCPMHPDVMSDTPGRCPICGMALEEMTASVSSAGPKERKIAYFRDPMGKNQRSPVPMKDEMGMDFIPVYEDELTASPGIMVDGRASISVAQEVQQSIGVVTKPVIRSRLVQEIRAVGRVAYDPELYAAIEEFRSAAKASAISKDLQRFSNSDQSSFAAAAGTRLSLLGLSAEQIEAISKGSFNARDFILPEGKAWVYAEIFESDLPLLKEGQTIEATVPSYPDRKFTGEIVSVNPLVDPASRTLRIRTQVSDPGHLLKPDMFADVRLHADLGEQLTIPASAVIHTGERDLVFVVDQTTGRFAPREIALGPKSEERFAVKSGLVEGETVVTSANFLVDSESRIRGVIDSAQSGAERTGGDR